MKKNKPNRSLILFYVLVAYVVLQFSWWAYHIFSLARQLHTDESLVARKVWMIGGEAIVFFGILIVGVYFVRKSFKRELELQQRHQNFALSITHELKTPIASSKLFIETLLSRELPEPKKNEILKKIFKDQTRLQKLVENILLSAKVDEIKVALEKQNLGLRQFISETITEMEGDDEISVFIDPQLHIQADPFYFISVIQNLHENASKYGNGAIIWKAKELPQHIKISIEDNGSGIPEFAKQKIFDRFHRLEDEHTRKSKGTGLGLFLVQKIIHFHQGHIIARNSEKGGAIFEITLPKNIN